jgi:hypothetical protein
VGLGRRPFARDQSGLTLPGFSARQGAPFSSPQIVAHVSRRFGRLLFPRTSLCATPYKGYCEDQQLITWAGPLKGIYTRILWHPALLSSLVLVHSTNPNPSSLILHQPTSHRALIMSSVITSAQEFPPPIQMNVKGRALTRDEVTERYRVFRGQLADLPFTPIEANSSGHFTLDDTRRGHRSMRRDGRSGKSFATFHWVGDEGTPFEGLSAAKSIWKRCR